MNPLDDNELDRALESWHVPGAGPELEAKALGAYRSQFRSVSRWKRVLTMRVRVPLPAAAAVVIMLVCSLVTLAHIELRTDPARGQRTALSRDAQAQPWGGLQPVAKLQPRVIRSQDEDD